MALAKFTVKQKAPPPVADINVTPMVDVMLVMLIIFMVITPMLSKGKDVDMVKTKNAIAMQAADKTDAIICAVTRDGKTYLNVTQMEPADSVRAKSSGPMTRATLNWMEFSATAFGRSFLSTSDGTSVW